VLEADSEGILEKKALPYNDGEGKIHSYLLRCGQSIKVILKKKEVLLLGRKKEGLPALPSPKKESHQFGGTPEKQEKKGEICNIQHCAHEDYEGGL